MDQANGTADRVRELQAKLTSQVDSLTSSEDWARMLEVAARFHHYSPNNCFLILSQMPDATRVAGYKTWQSLERQVRKGEHGIKILAPRPWKREAREGEAGATDDGTIAGVSFAVVSVFDVSQTDGNEIPDVRPVLLAGQAPAGLWDGVAAQVAAAGYSIERGDCHGANGYTDPLTKAVRVRADVDDAQACKTLAHELGHIVCGHCNDGADYHGCRGRAEVEAESVAYIVAAASNMSTDGYSLPYVARWAAGDPKVVRDTADRVIVGQTDRPQSDSVGTR